MNKYKVNVSRDDYGYIILTAKDENQAREIIEAGEWRDDELVLKGGNMTVDIIELLD